MVEKLEKLKKGEHKLNIFPVICGHFFLESINITESQSGLGWNIFLNSKDVPPAWEVSHLEVRHLSGFLEHFKRLHACTHICSRKNPINSSFLTFPKMFPIYIFTWIWSFSYTMKKVLSQMCLFSPREQKKAGRSSFLSEITPAWEKTQQWQCLVSFLKSKD